MNTLDLVILGLVLVAVAFGCVRGFWLTVFEYVGLVVGVMGGAALAPRVLERVPIEATGLRVLIVVLLLGGGASVGSSIMHAAGEPVRQAANGLRTMRFLDHLAGGVLTAVVALSIAWYVGASVSHGPIPDVAAQVQQSTVMRALGGIAPRPPMPFARLREQLAGDLLPQLFAGLEPTLPGGLQPDPLTMQSEGVRRAAASTVKVQAPGCGGVNFGSGVVIAPGRVLTNAHVVSGTRSVTIVQPGASRSVAAEVIAFDPARDVAVLDVPGLRLEPLALGRPVRGTQAAIVGYPGGGPEQVAPAVVQGEIRGEGRDIYDRSAVNRQILVLSGRARPGNSGGPLVDADGQVIGIVFAGSVSRPEQSYALSLGEVTPAMQAAATAEGGISMRAYRCVS